MKDKKTKVAIETKATIKRVVKNGTVFHNINLQLGCMSFEIEPKFLNSKQRGLLFHECERLTGEEYTDEKGKTHILRARKVGGVKNVNKQTNKK